MSIRPHVEDLYRDVFPQVPVVGLPGVAEGALAQVGHLRLSGGIDVDPPQNADSVLEAQNKHMLLLVPSFFCLGGREY